MKESVAFDFLLPIGSACQTRYQVERFLRKKYNITQPACFFDWLGLGGVKGVKYMIENDFHLSASEFIVDSAYNKNHFAPIHTSSGFRFQHDFGFTPLICKDPILGGEYLKKNMGNSLEKYNYLGDRTRSILSSNSNIGLVYQGRIKEIHFDGFFDLLKSKYNSSFYLINLIQKGGENFFIESDNNINLIIDNTSVRGADNEWQGCDDSWDNALDTILVNSNKLYKNFKK